MIRAALRLARLPGGLLIMAALGIASPSFRQAWREVFEDFRRRASSRREVLVTLYDTPTGNCDQLVVVCLQCNTDWYAFDPRAEPQDCPRCGADLL